MPGKNTFRFACLLTALIALPNHLFSEPRNNEKAQRVEKLTKWRVEGLRALDTHNYRKAEEIFLRILKLDIESWLDENEFNEVILCFCKAKVCTKQFREAEAILSKLHVSALDDQLSYFHQILLAQIRYEQKSARAAMKLLAQLKSKQPLNNWEVDDQKFFLRVKSQVDSYFEELFTQAERCYESSLFSETLPIYQEILEAISEGVYEQDKDSKLLFQVRLRIAYSEYQLHNYAKAKKVYLDTKALFPLFFDPQSFLQLIVCTRNLGQHQEALELCQDFFTYKFSPKKQDLVYFQKACILIDLKQPDRAKKILNSLINSGQNQALSQQARFEIAKLLLTERRFDEVEEVLHPNYFRFDSENSGKADWAFLRSEALYQRKQYELAAAGYSEVLQCVDFGKPLHQKAKVSLGYCYLKLAEDRLTQVHSRRELIEKAENHFLSVFNSKPSDELALSLARTYLIDYYYLNSQEAQQKWDSLLKKYSFTSLEAQLDAGFISADMTPEVEKKENIYQSLLSEQFSKASNYSKANYYYASFLMARYQRERNESLVFKSISFYKKTLDYLQNKQSRLAENTRKSIARAYLSFCDEENLKTGLTDIDSLVASAQLEASKALFDLLCLKAEISLKLMSFDLKTYFAETLKSLDEALKTNPVSENHQQVQFLKAKAHFQAKEYSQAKQLFASLIEKYPSSALYADACFWLAECCELLSEDPSKIQYLRQKIYRDYPAHPLAAESYFITYSFSEYLEGDHDAIHHLSKLQEHFQDSPYTVAANYLLGLYHKQGERKEQGRSIQEKNLTQAIDHFLKAKEIFDDQYDKNLIAVSNIRYFLSIYYRSIISAAQCYLEKADQCEEATRHMHLNKAASLFSEIISDFDSSTGSFAKLMRKENPLPNVLEEALFGRAIAAAKDGEIKDSEVCFYDLIRRCAQVNIQNGHYLSRAWYELSAMAMAKGEYQEALNLLNRSESTLDPSVTDADHKINIGIEQSMCYRLLNQFDMAMLTLSKVVNEGVISNLRVKAMVLRAEIYELQGRRDLAQKQLEAAAKKGGEWSCLAKDKLVKEYGYN